MVLQTPDKQGWFWYIPQHDNIVSVGVVGPFDYLFKNRGKDFEKIFNEEVERTPAVKPRIEKATRVTGYFATKDYSYRTTRAAGDGWVLVGDAWGFLDPLVFVGRAAGAEVGRARRRRDRRGAEEGRHVRRAARRWAANFNVGVDRMRRLVCEYYAGFSFGNFMREHPEMRGTVTDLLIGDLFTDRVDKVWAPMEAMYPENKHVIPPWNAGIAVTDAPEKANELFVPDRLRP